MPTNRKVVFANGEYYHVFNRGVEKRLTFTNKYEFIRGMDSMDFYRFAGLSIRYSKFLNLDKEKKELFLKEINKTNLHVEIIAFCLMDNHFHLLLKQVKNGGIVKFMAKFTNSYTKYFNTKHNRVGPLFQGVFKAVHVDNDDQLLHLTRYIHLNPVTGYVVEAARLQDYKWSSYPEYINKVKTRISNKNQVLSFFKKPGDYEKFVLDQADYARRIKDIDHLTFD